MGNTEMTKYMAAGAFQDLTRARRVRELVDVAPGLAAAGVYNGKLLGVPYYAGSRVVTYRTDLFKKANIKVPKTLAQYTLAAKKLGTMDKDKSFSPVYVAGTDWYVAMGFVYDFGGSIAKQAGKRWSGQLATPASIAGLTAYKNFFLASRGRRRRRTRPTRTPMTSTHRGRSHR